MLVKLQKIQSLESFVLMAIQGTQVPMYTNTLFFFFLLFSFVLFCFSYKKIEKSEKYKNSVCVCVCVCVCTLVLMCVCVCVCVLWMAIETKFSKLCIFCSLDEHLYAQLSK